MKAMATQPLPTPTHAFSLRALLRHGLINAAFCCLVGTALALSSGRHWDQQLVYSLAIGMTIWLCVDLGRFLVLRGSDGSWPTGWRGIALVLFGIATGFVVGSAVGDWYCGCSTWDRLSLAPSRLLTSLLVTISAGAVGSYFFYSRAKQQAQQALIARAERDAMQARLQLLQSQLEPHMLFNTLANLRVLVGTDPAQATRMLDHLVAYLRATLTASRATEHSLAQEFDRLRDYLELMAVRMGPRLRYRLDLPAELADWPVPTLLLQALVENSIRHGLEPQVEGGCVSVAASATPQGLQLQVRDTGVGLAPHSGSGGTGFGLLQVRERLAARFGQSAHLVVKPSAQGGTLALITLPPKAGGLGACPVATPSPTELCATRKQ